jgi:hypothetical protein
VLWLAASNTSRSYSMACYPSYPAPKGTCHPNVHSSIYLPLWGWDVTASVTRGDTYAVKIKFYVS